MENSPQDFEHSDFIRREATNSNGELVQEIWDAIIEREHAIEEIINSGIMDNHEVIKSTRFLEKSQNVRKLQELYGIESY